MSNVRSLIIVWAALLLLLSLTVAASFVTTGVVSLTVSTSIALVKASLIFWFYMHLKEEGGLIRLVAIGAGAWLLILLLLSSSDFATRNLF